MPLDAAPQEFKYNNVLRDGVQSNQGTNLSADEIIEMLIHTRDAGYKEYQISGGTFMDLFLKKGRDAWGENSKLFAHFQEVTTSALIRGDCLVAYKRSPQDVIDAVIEELAIRGLNVVTNFHGLNFAPAQEGVFKAVKKAQEKGHSIKAPKVVCIEDNPNITVEGCIEALRQQASMGADEGIYLKNASGKVDPEFVYELVKRVAEEFPGQEITLHTHDNHGMADAIYYFGGLAAAETNASITFDVLPRPMASGTAQPPIWRIQKMFAESPIKALQERAGLYDESLEAADFDKQYEARHLYGASEVRYSKDAWYKCFLAGMAGGAMAAIKGMGILDTIRGMYGLKDEDQALGLVAEIEADVKSLFGYPTSVTPYQKLMDEQAGLEARIRHPDGLYWRDNKLGKYQPFTQLGENAAHYLSGGLGPVPMSASPRLVEIALQKRGLDKIEPFVSPEDLPQLMEETRKKIVDAGYENPTQAEVTQAAMFGDAGFDEVMIRSGQSNLTGHFEKVSSETSVGRAKAASPKITKVLKQPKPQQPPEWPAYLKPPSKDYVFKQANKIREYDVASAIGAADLERFALATAELQKHADGFYKVKIGGAGFHQRSKYGQPNTEIESDIVTHHEFLRRQQQQARQVARQEIQAFMDSIPRKLKAYGMSQKQASVAMMSHVPPLLDKIAETKAKGGASIPRPSPSTNSTVLSVYAKVDAFEPAAIPA